MSYKTIDVYGKPWMVCDESVANEVQNFILNSGVPAAATTVRAADPAEVARLTATRLVNQMMGEDPFKLFAISL